LILCFIGRDKFLKPSVMKLNSSWLSCFFLLVPFFAFSQVVPPKDSAALTHTKDSTAMHHATDSVAKHDSTIHAHDSSLAVKKDTLFTPKSCYSVWHDAFRTRGAKPVPDGMQQIVIALKGEETSQCFMGQVMVSGGKIKPPLYFQQENGDYKLVSLVGKKIEPAFEGSVTPEELYAIKDGMSIVFRTTDKEYCRLFFYMYVNKSAQSNKSALSPEELIKD
jgi:hypothetical protein